MSSPVTHVEAGALVSERSYLRQVFGALSLYLDFINLFISLLRIFGSRN